MTHTYSHSDIPTLQPVCRQLQLPTCQLGQQQNISWWWEPGFLGNSQWPRVTVWPQKKQPEFLLSPTECQYQPGPGLGDCSPG